MVKKKSRAIVQVADGSGGMVRVEDKRFEQGDWPILLTVPSGRADFWFAYLSAECRKRGWHSAGISQLEAKENSGSKRVTTQNSDVLDIVWERKRNGELKLKAKVTSDSEEFLEEATAFIAQVEERSSAGKTAQFFHAWQLSYRGLPWKGEFWLDDTIRLRPPSQQYEDALLGPRIVLVEALVDGIDRMHAKERFQTVLREVAIFLSVVLGKTVQVPKSGKSQWTWKSTPNGDIETDVRNTEYWEKRFPDKMAAKGEFRPVPLRSIARPDFSERGITDETELILPDDMDTLWRGFTDLNGEHRQQFLQVGTLWKLALSLDHEYLTTRFALMVIACEALKPREREYRKHNVYHVVAALLGESTAQALREQLIKPQEIRNVHLHSAEFRGAEFVEPAIRSNFDDPTFEEACCKLYVTAQAAIIAWLMQGGVVVLSPIKRRKTWRRRIRDHALWLIPFVFVVGVILGAVFT